MYSLDQLRGFIAVAEERNFSRAAERLHMTQPPLSRQVLQLERVLGFKLFERTTRALHLTRAGKVFLDDARRILALVAAAPLHAQRIATGTSGRIDVGFTAVAALTIFGDWIDLVHERLPNIDIALNEMVTAQQLDALYARELDLGFLRGTTTSAVLQSRLVYREPFVVAVPSDHALRDLGRCPTLHDVARYPLITYTPAEARYHHELTVALFRDADLRPSYAQYVTQVHSQLVLVGAALGIALVPRSAGRLRPPGVEVLPIDIEQERYVELRVAWRQDNDNPALQRALAALDDLVEPGLGE